MFILSKPIFFCGLVLMFHALMLHALMLHEDIRDIGKNLNIKHGSLLSLEAFFFFGLIHLWNDFSNCLFGKT
jgi:hypothetical protein